MTRTDGCEAGQGQPVDLGGSDPPEVNTMDQPDSGNETGNGTTGDRQANEQAMTGQQRLLALGIIAVVGAALVILILTADGGRRRF